MTNVIANDLPGAFDVIFGIFRNFISALKHLHLSDGVSLFAFMVAILIMGIVIAGLINIVHTPNIESSSHAVRRRSQ